MRIILFATFAFLSSGLLANNDWVKKEAFGGTKRERMISFAIGGRGYVGMGQDTAELMNNDLWEYDPGVDSWTQKANCPGIARRNAAVFVINTSAYVVGGVDNAVSWMGNVLNDTWEYSPVTNTWVQRAACPIQSGWGVYYSTGFSVNGRGYICCGKYAQSSYSQQTWEYNPATNTWLQRASYPGGTRYGMCSFVLGNSAYIGTGADENAFTADFWRFTPSTNSWSAIAPFPASARFTASGFSMNGLGYVLFGTDGGYKDELYEYDPTFNQWTQRKSFEGGGRRNAAALVIGGRAYAGMGKSASGCRRDFWEYTPYVPVGMNEYSNGDFPFAMYPNPMVTSSTLSFTLPEGEDLFAFEIYDLAGKRVREQGNMGTGAQGNSGTIVIERGNLIPGNYIAKLITTGGFSATVKFIVQ